MTKEESEIFYNNLKKEYTDEEIAESFVWSIELSPEEEKENNRQFKEFIKQRYSNMSFFEELKTKVKIKYIGLKYKIQDIIYKIKNKNE